MIDFQFSNRTQLVIVAVTASLATATLLFAYDQRDKQERRKRLSLDVQQSLATQQTPSIDVDDGNTAASQPGPEVFEDNGRAGYDEELVREQLSRNYSFFGDEGMRKIREGNVVVVGCGGVGSWAAVMLVRSGVSKIRLVDFDYVTLSSLNRHATATLADVGTPKVKCIERTLRQISKWVDVDSRIDIWRKGDGGLLLENTDWVVDAIDNISTKVDLLKYCHDHGIKVFSSMGAGAKCDPTRIQISDVSHTIYDPLARSVRRRLRLQGVLSGIPVVYSTEVPGDVKLLPLPEEEFQKGDLKELGVFDDFRVRILPVFGPLPSIFGLHVATYILCELAGKPIANPLAIRRRKKLYEKLYRDLLFRESKIAGQVMNKLPIDEDDVALIFEDFHRGRSIIPPHAVPSRPVVLRWNPDGPLVIENCVVMEFNEGEKHIKECYGERRRPPGDVWGEEVNKIVEEREKEVKRMKGWMTA